MTIQAAHSAARNVNGKVVKREMQNELIALWDKRGRLPAQIVAKL
jgi:hypothetical protein